MRIVKKPEVRKKEIIEAGLKVLYSKGYAQTTVQDIVDTAGIAKGTFYWYFRSKDELIDALAEDMREKLMDIARGIVGDRALNASEKFYQVFNKIAIEKIKRFGEGVYVIIDFLIDPKNAQFQYILNKKSMEHFASVLAEIIKQGVDEGIFHVYSPYGAARIVSALLIQASDEIMERLKELRENGAVDIDRIKDIYRLYFDAIERVLGADRNKFSLWNNLSESIEAIDEFLKLLKKEDK